MTILDAIILGIVEGITEFLPISSTGHLIITAALLGLDEPEETEQAVKAFNIVIQGGAILAVLGLYWPRVKQMLRGVAGHDRTGLRLFVNLFIAFLPAAVLGVLLHGWIEEQLFAPGPVIAALAIGGVVMIVLTPWQRRVFERESDGRDTAYEEIDSLPCHKAFIIGLLQCVAMWPGTSRSMMTIVGGMVVGLRPRQAAEFSFLLGLPTLGGACVYQAFENLTDDSTPNMFEVIGWDRVLIGLVVGFIAAALAVKWLVAFLSNHGVALFGWYRLGLCALLGLLIWQGVLTFPTSEDSGDDESVNHTEPASSATRSE